MVCRFCRDEIPDGAVRCRSCGSTQAAGRSRVTAALVAILLGGIGLHKFYTGKWVWGILYLVFSWTFVPLVLGVLEGFYYLCISQARFETSVLGLPPRT